jgi:ParB family chromosome partitioning protein
MKAASEVVEFPISGIKGFFYERKVFSSERLNELAKDVAQKGVLKNIVIVKKLLSNKDKKVIGENMVVAGFRTTKASMMAKRKTIPARVYGALTELEATDILLSENIHFEDMNDYDIAQNLKRYIEAGIPQKDIAARINKSESYVSLYLQLLKDSEPIQKAIATQPEAFTEKHARVVRQLPPKLHEKAVTLVKGKTVREAKEVVQKIAEENKAVVLKAQIKELQDRLKALDKAEKEKEELNRKIAELSGKAKALTPSSMDVKRLIGKIERIRTGYFPRKERLTQLKSRRKELMKTMPTFDIKPIEKEREEVYTIIAKKQTKIKALKEELSKLREEERKLQAEAKRLTEKIQLVTTTRQQLKKIETEIKDLEPQIRDMEKDLGKEIKDYDKLVKTVETSEKELLQQRETLFKQIAELKEKQRSLNGKIANRSLLEKRLENLKKELRNLKA